MGGSVADPHGFLFWFDGGLYRSVRGPVARTYKGLFASGVIDKLIQRGLIETEISSLSMKGYDVILQHRPIPFPSYPYEWSAEMLRDAARLTCDFKLACERHRLTIKDAHGWNVLFEGTKPRFVDFNSILPRDAKSHRNATWNREFERAFLYPLYLNAAGKERAARRLLFRCEAHMTRYELLKHLPKHYLAKHITSQTKRKIRELFRAASALHHLKMSLEEIRLHEGRTDCSSDYKEGFPACRTEETRTLKHCIVYELLDRLRPTTLLDLKSHRGWFSFLAADLGASVIAVDSDAACVESIYVQATRKKKAILPLIMNFSDLSRECKGDTTGEHYPPPTERLRSEMVLALNLVHHLVFEQSLSFVRIVETLSSLTTKSLLVEFVPRDDLSVMERYSDEYQWYTLANFVGELRRKFKDIEIFDSYPLPRKLLLANH